MADSGRRTVPHGPLQPLSRRAPWPALLLSGGAYFSFVVVGIRIFTFPWAGPVDAQTAGIAARAIPLFVCHYLLECIAARALGVVTLYTWHPSEVLQHHFAGAALLSPVLLLHAWAPEEWAFFVQHHTPLLSIAASGFLTGLNEGLFVMRSLAPSGLADALLVRKAQRIVTLCVLAVNMPTMLASCVLAMVPPQLTVLTACVHGPCGAFGQLRRALSLLSYAACAIFCLVVQRSYVLSNLRHLGLLHGAGLPPAKFAD